jgi:hypothetical protein
MTEEVRTGWAIPPAQFTELETLFTAAEALLEQARSSERTPVVTEQCREAFAALTAKMRFFKSHYFLVPLLASADLVDLGLKPHDTHPTPSGKPVALVRADPYLWAPRELWLRIGYVFGDPEDKANKGYRIWYKVVPAGAAPVTDTEELDKSFYTRRKRDLLTFGYEDYGKTVYIAVQVENNGIKGNWGPMIWATVP